MSALTSPRNFARYTTAGFDGATAETAVYTQLRSEWTTPTDSRVGVWSFSALQRAAGDPLAASIASIARVALEGVIALGDTVDVLDSTGAVRISFAASAEGTTWFFLGPQDSIAITSAGATKADILVQDLNSANLPWWVLTEATQANIPVNPLPYSEGTLVGAAVVSDWVGRRMEYLSLAVGGGNVTLPALANIALGDTITFLRTPGSQVPTVVTSAPGDAVNGLTGAAADYVFRSVAQSVEYQRVTGGWTRRAGFAVPTRFDSGLVSPVQIPAFQEGTLFVVDQMVGAGDILTLPALADCAAGVRIVIRITGAGLPAGSSHSLFPAIGESINGFPAGVPFQYLAGPGIGTNASVVVIEHAGSFWSVSANTSDVPFDTAVIAAGAIPAVGGKQNVRITLAADGDVTLPDPALLPLGSTLALTRVAGAGTPRIIPHNGVVTINGVAGVTAGQWYLTSAGKSITYTRTQGDAWTRDQEWAQQQYVNIGGPGIVPSVAGELIAEFSSGLGATIVLPALTSVPLGASIYFFRSGVGTPTITCDNAADLVNGIPAAGGNTWRLMNGGESVLYVRVPGGWWRNTPIVFIGISSAADITASTAREQYYRMTGGAGQALNLPALSTVDTGTTIYQFNNGGAAHSLVPSGTDLINNVNAAVANAVGTRTQIVSMGPTIGWITILSA